METKETKWVKRPQSTVSQRKVDKELQRIKSLAVVSVLNKSFQDTALPPPPSSRPSILPVMSPSSSLTTSSTTSDQDSFSNLKARSRSISHTSFTATKYSANRPNSVCLQSDSQSIKAPSLPEPLEQDNSLEAEKKMSDHLVIDHEKEALKKRLDELQTLYDSSSQELDQLKVQKETQTELLLLQDKLIQEMTSHLEDVNTNSINGNTENEDISQEDLVHAHRELRALRAELEQFRPLKTEYEVIISGMTRQLEAYEQRMDEIEKMARDIQKENEAQLLYIDTKVQSLVDKLLERNQTISKLQYEQHLEKQLPKPEDTKSNRSNSIKSANDSATIWEQFTHESASSTRSSFVSTDNNLTKSLTARWKGTVVPPASPPPSLPLPPIPTTSRPKSTLSEVSGNSSIHIKDNKHMSIDAVGGASHRRTSVQSEIDEQALEAAYYKEFTDQLQARLSISKEIDDLRVWEPSDFERIQKKLDSKHWSENEDGSSEKDQHAFWKGMKKKLRV